jgi:hypothetical protein
MCSVRCAGALLQRKGHILTYATVSVCMTLGSWCVYMCQFACSFPFLCAVVCVYIRKKSTHARTHTHTHTHELRALTMRNTQKKQTMSHSLYSSSKIAVEFEDEEGLKDLCLELRELEAEVCSCVCVCASRTSQRSANRELKVSYTSSLRSTSSSRSHTLVASTYTGTSRLKLLVYEALSCYWRASWTSVLCFWNSRGRVGRSICSALLCSALLYMLCFRGRVGCSICSALHCSAYVLLYSYLTYSMRTWESTEDPSV